MTTPTAIYVTPRATLVADTCEPLRAAHAAGDIALEAWVHGHYPGRVLPDDVLTEIPTVGFWDASHSQQWGLDWHYNEGIELTYLESGRLAFGCESKEHLLTSGALTITRPWQRHRVGAPNIGASRLHWLLVDVGVRRPNQEWTWPGWLVCSPDDLRRLQTLLRRNHQPVWTAHDDVAEAFVRLSKAAREEHTPARALKMKLHINAVIVSLLEMLESEQIVLDTHLASSERTVELFLARLEEDVSSDWTLDRMAKACGLRRSRFTYYCRKVSNLTPAQFLIHARVRAASTMLARDPTKTVTQIAFDCGFASSQHFATSFRRAVGMTPSEFRRKTAA